MLCVHVICILKDCVYVRGPRRARDGWNEGLELHAGLKYGKGMMHIFTYTRMSLTGNVCK